MPRVFKKLRSLQDIKHREATEFRQILLYTGPLVLKSVLSQEKYTPFVSLHVAIRMLSAHQCTNIDYAEELLVHFIKWFLDLYGPEQILHNVHGLIHLANDARMFEALDQFSAFKFENYMKTLKNIEYKQI